MHIARVADRAVREVRRRVPWLDDPVNTESPLPYVADRPSVKPVLPVPDMAAAIGFYRSIGFAVDAYDARYVWVRTCGWEFFHVVHAPDLEAGSSHAGAFVHVADVDEWHRSIAANAPDVELGDVVAQPWGMREFVVSDPAGNVIRFGQNV